MGLTRWSSLFGVPSLKRSSRRRGPSRPRRVLELERLEERLTPAVYDWLPTAAGTYDWNDDANWSGTGFPNAAADIANINLDITGNQTVRLNQAVTVGTINLGDTVGSSTITLAAGTAGSLNLVGVATVAKTGSGLDTIAASITGSGSLNKTGPGTLILSAANSYSGTTIRQGTLRLDHVSAAGSGTITLGDADSAGIAQTLAANVASGMFQNPVVVSAVGTGTATLRGDQNFLSFAGPLTLNRPTTLDGNAADRYGISGKISGSVGMLTVNAPRVTLDQPAGNANDFTGGVLINAAKTLQMGTVHGLNASHAVTANGLLRLVVGANNTARIGALNGTGAVNGDTGGGNYAKTLSVGGDDGDGVFAGVISNGQAGDTLQLVKTGTGIQTLTGANTYRGGTTLNAGTLQAGSSAALGTGPLTLNGGTLATGSGSAPLVGFLDDGWQVNQTGVYTTSPFTNETLTLTDGNTGQARSTFFDTRVSTTGSFAVGFTYHPPAGTNSADGIAFVLHNDPRGAAARGAIGGALGYGGTGGITNSIAVAFNLYASGTVGTGLFTNGTVGSYQSVGPVNLTSGNPIRVTLLYDAQAQRLTEILTEQNTSNTFTTTYSVNLAAVLGDSQAYVGFTGGAGSVTSVQRVSNFSFDAFTNAVTVAGNAVIDVADGSYATLAGAVQGAGTLTKTGGGVLALSGPVSNSGDTTVSEGTLSLVNQALRSAAVTIDSGAVLEYAVPVNTSLAQTSPNTATPLTFAGGGTLRKNGGGSLTFGGTNGNIHWELGAGALIDVQQGILIGGNNLKNVWTNNLSDLYIDSDAEFWGVEANVRVNALDGPAGAVLATGLNHPSYSSFTVGVNGGGGTFAGSVIDHDFSAGNRGSLTKVGNGTFILSGDNTYSGGTTISQGTLQIGDGGETGSLGTGDVTNHGTLAFWRRYHSVPNVISGSGGVQLLGGLTTLTADNTYSGGTTIGVGYLEVGEDGASGSLGTGPITNHGNLHFGRSDIFTVPNPIGGGGSLGHYGSGTLILTGTNSYTGRTTIVAGTLRIGSTDALPQDTDMMFLEHIGTLDLNGFSPTIAGLSGRGMVTNSVAVAVALTLDTGFEDFGFSGRIQDGSGSIALTKTGIGTQILYGDNTYTGGTTISQGTLQVGISGAETGSLGTGDVTNHGTLAFWGSGLVASNVISGSGGVEVLGGDITLTADNTYTGGTTIREGDLQVGDGDTSGSLGSGAVTTNGSLLFNRSDTFTVPNPIGGSGRLYHRGSGTVILTGTNSYTGGTWLGYGTLQVGSSGALPVGGDINGYSDFYAPLDLNGFSPTVGALRGYGIVTNSVAGVVTLTIDTSAEGNFLGIIQDGNGTVALVKTGTGTQILSGDNTYTGGTTISQGTLRIGSSGRPGSLGSGDVINHGTLVFLLNTLVVPNLISGSGDVQIIGSNLTFTADNTYTGSTRLVEATLQVGNGGTSGGLSPGAVLGDGHLIFNRSDTLTVPNDIGGSFQLTHAGSGTLILTGTNTFNGVLSIASGTLQIGSSDALPAGCWVDFDQAMGTLDLNGFSPTVGALLGNGVVTTSVAGAVTLTIAAEATDYSFIFYGRIQDGGGVVGLAKAESGTQYLFGDNTYTGGTTISQGTLQVGSGGTTGSLGTGDVINHGTLAFYHSGLVVPNVISGSGDVEVLGGVITLTADNTYSGGTTINEERFIGAAEGGFASGVPTLRVGDGGTGGSLGSGPVTNDGRLIFNHSDTLPVSNSIDGSGSLTKIGSGTLLLTGDNTYLGATTIGQGTLQVGDGGASGSLGWGAVTNDASLVFNRSDSLTVPNPIRGAGSLTQAGSSTVHLTGINSYSGNTTVTAGNLAAATPGALGTGTITLSRGTLTASPEFGSATGFGIDGTGWTTQSDSITSPPISNNVLTLTDDSYQTRSAFLSTPVATGANFTAAFTYTASASNFDFAWPGVAFVLQNATGSSQGGAGAAALGDGELGLGYSGIEGSSLAIVLNLTNRSGRGISYSTGGELSPFQSIEPVALNNANPKQVTLNYDAAAQTLTVTIAEENTANLFTHVYTDVDLSSVLGGPAAYVGFTGSTVGEVVFTQRISNFTFSQSAINTAYPNSVRVNGSASLHVLASPLPLTLSDLSFENGGALSVGVDGSVPANQDYAVTFGTASVAGTATLDVVANGTGTATVTLGGWSAADPSAVLNVGGTGCVVQSVANSFFDGAVVIDAQATLVGAGDDALWTSAIRVNGTLDLNGHQATTGILTGNGVVTNRRAGSATLMVDSDSDGTFGGTLQDGDGLVALSKGGAGTLALTGSSPYRGGTTIGEGILQVGDGGTSGSLGSGDVTNNASLVFNRSDTITVANSISGSGSVTQTGPGVLVLTGANTYTGGTTISGGTLAGRGTINGPVTVTGSGHLAPGDSGSSTGTLSTGDVTFVGGTAFDADLNGTSAGTSHDQLAVTGDLDLSGAPTLNLTLGYTPLLNDSYTIVTATGHITGTFDGLADGGWVRVGGLLFQIHYTANAVTLTRVQQVVTVTATGSQTYGGSNQTFTPNYAGFLLGEDASVVGGTPMFSTDAASRSPVGGSYTASVDVSGLSATNYTFVPGTPGTFLVSPAPLTVTATGVPKVYDGTTPATVNLSDNRVVGDALTVTYTSALFDTKDVGTGKTVTVSGLSLAGTDAGNYSLVTGSITTTASISPLPITVTGNPQSKTYGDIDPVLTFQLTSGSVVVGDTFSGGLTRNVGENVGSYAITQGSLTLGHNYTLNYVGTNLTITPRALTITARSTSKTYGQPLILTGTEFTTVGLLPGDTVAGVSLSSAGVAASAPVAGSPYAITASAATGTGLGNYAITYVDGSLNVQQANLTITADNLSKVTEAPLPTLTATYSGFVNGDGPNVVTGLELTTPATASSPPGTYPITVADGTAVNYAITHVPGTLTVVDPLPPGNQALPSPGDQAVPAPPAGPISVLLVQLGRGKKVRLTARVAFSGGLLSRDVASPFQKPRASGISVELVPAGLLFRARRGKRLVSRLVLL